jgi:hypothetical protein
MWQADESALSLLAGFAECCRSLLPLAGPVQTTVTGMIG